MPMDPGTITLHPNDDMLQIPPNLDNFTTTVWNFLLKEHNVYASAIKSVDALRREGPTLTLKCICCNAPRRNMATEERQEAQGAAEIQPEAPPKKKQRKIDAHCGVEFKATLKRECQQITLVQRDGINHTDRAKLIQNKTVEQWKIWADLPDQSTVQQAGQLYEAKGVPAPSKKSLKNACGYQPMSDNVLKVSLSVGALKAFLDGRTREELVKRGEYTKYSLIASTSGNTTSQFE